MAFGAQTHLNLRARTVAVEPRAGRRRYLAARFDVTAVKGMTFGAQRNTYEHAPLLLNLELGADGTWRLASTWCNLGLWTTATSFRSACADLARLLGRAASLGAGDEVLDVGVGYGDQVALWLDEFGVERVVALESSPKIAAAASSALADRAAATVVNENASHLSARALTSAPASFDVVLCLDCAYHFSTRASYIASAAPLLRPAGRFAAIDLLPTAQSRWGLGRLAQGLVALAVGIPWSNLYGEAEYGLTLRSNGLVDVSIRPVDGAVFAPLGVYASEQRRRLRC